MTVITFGTFDILHIGHINILRRARAMGDRLVVGVSSDELNFAKKGRYPVYPQAERCELVGVVLMWAVAAAMGRRPKVVA